MELDLNNFSAKKYKESIYQIRLSAYLSKCEDFEEVDFIKSENEYFTSCYYSADAYSYQWANIHWNELRREMGEVHYDYKPYFDSETSQYLAINPSEEERLKKTFSVIINFLAEKEIMNIKIIESQQIVESGSFSFKNNFDHVASEKVFQYFKTNLVDKNYLTLEDLRKYLIIAFQDKIVSDKKFVLNGSFKYGEVRAIFYKYFNDIAKDKHGLKIEYCKLLGEYFEGFNTIKISNNFNK
jgi:hypothetical protein